ncbi:MAG: hypothetical protein QOE61_77, partial [Micromonosporaceae bacterium]|nr:hypothetical protein [Micromonosporaceae bacterium]
MSEADARAKRAVRATERIHPTRRPPNPPHTEPPVWIDRV